jgi:hypothetical protein
MVYEQRHFQGGSNLGWPLLNLTSLCRMKVGLTVIILYSKAANYPHCILLYPSSSIA